MKTDILEIRKENAIAAFKSATAEGKALLTNLFGKGKLYEKITDHVKTFEDIEEIAGVNISRRTNETDDELAYRQLVLITKTLNEGWIPDWSDSNQYKYTPYFKEKSGFGLSYIVTSCWRTCSDVSSRLCFKSRELAEFAGKQFADIYRDYLTIKP